jgi:hypothetical protein
MTLFAISGLQKVSIRFWGPTPPMALEIDLPPFKIIKSKCHKKTGIGNFVYLSSTAAVFCMYSVDKIRLRYKRTKCLGGCLARTHIGPEFHPGTVVHTCTYIQTSWTQKECRDEIWLEIWQRRLRPTWLLSNTPVPSPSPHPNFAFTFTLCLHSTVRKSSFHACLHTWHLLKRCLFLRPSLYLRMKQWGSTLVYIRRERDTCQGNRQTC